MSSDDIDIVPDDSDAPVEVWAPAGRAGAAPGAAADPTDAGDAATLCAAGWTVSEIARRQGRSDQDVAAELAATPDAGAITAAHRIRAEHALADAAIGGTRWREAATKQGDVVTLTEQRPPDPRAAQALLTKLDPAGYGRAAGDSAPRVYVIPMSAAELRAMRTGTTFDAMPAASQAATPGVAFEAGGGGD